jgi:hypothetical protein
MTVRFSFLLAAGATRNQFSFARAAYKKPAAAPKKQIPIG